VRYILAVFWNNTYMSVGSRIFVNVYILFAFLDNYDVWSAWQWEDSVGQ
jgi:hypothetical protein